MEDDKPVQEMSDAELEEVIRTARRSGALPTSHTVIERRIVDPKNPVRPVIDGDASEAD